MGQIFITDPLTGHLVQVGDAEHELHSGNHYIYTNFDIDLDIVDTIEIIIDVDNSGIVPHLLFLVDGQLSTRIELFETTTHTNGAEQTKFNNNRNSLNESSTKLYLSAGGGSDGTRIFVDQLGISTGGGANSIVSGGQNRGDSEFILKANTKYLFKISSLTDENQVSYKLTWYDHAI